MSVSHARAASAWDLDRLSRGDSPAHRLDPRAKALGALALILAVVDVPPGRAWKLALVAGLVLAYAAVARVPVRFLLARTAAVLPFVLVFAVTAPLLRGPAAHNLALAACVVAKAATSILAATALVATTPWHRLLEGLERLRVPRALVLVLHFLHRYLFVLLDELAALRRARAARLTRPMRPGLALASGTGMIGALFLRTLERSERIEAAMAARGFTGEVRALGALRFGARDAAFLAAALAIAAAVRLA